MHKSPKVELSWLFKMAWRDGKASIKKLILFMASIVLGIAAVVSIQSFGENLKLNIAKESKALMGADFRIDSDSPPNERLQQIMDSLGGFQAQEISFASMAAFPVNQTSKLVQVRGLEYEYPFYGEIETIPAEAASFYHSQSGALVDATAMLQLGVKLGDSVKIGNVTLPILGKLKNMPGTSAVFTSVAPTVVIPFSYIELSGLVQTGSRIGYDFYFKSPSTDLELLEREVDPLLDIEAADLDTHTSTSERLGNRYDNFGKFLNLVAFIALLLGCVGIASAIYIYIKTKLRAIAVLKCLGATKQQTFLIFLIQVASIGLVGGIFGTALGAILQQIFPFILEGLLPVDIEVAYSIPILFMGIILGVFMSILFALYPLIETLYVSPLQALRVVIEHKGKSRKAIILVSLGIIVFIFGFSYWLLKQWQYALGFVIGVLVTFSILTVMAYVFMRMIKKFFPHSWGFVPRQSLLNLFRPQNQTLTLVLSIGVGTFLISTLYFTKDVLLSQASIESQADSPNMILLDVQSSQQDALRKTINRNGLSLVSDVPIVTMRLKSLKSIPVEEIKRDSVSNINSWILDHEFRTTYRDELTHSETLKSGLWTTEVNKSEPIPISVSDNFAVDAQVDIGDELSFNVQGVTLKTVVGSIRTVDWSQMDLNFLVVFRREYSSKHHNLELSRQKCQMKLLPHVFSRI